jgi:hypothetical protein
MGSMKAYASSTDPVDEKCIQTLSTTAQRKRSYGRPKNKWENDIKIDIRKTVCADVHWIHVLHIV